jgi:hypothetical protein
MNFKSQVNETFDFLKNISIKYNFVYIYPFWHFPFACCNTQNKNKYQNLQKSDRLWITNNTLWYSRYEVCQQIMYGSYTLQDKRQSKWANTQILNFYCFSKLIQWFCLQSIPAENHWQTSSHNIEYTLPEQGSNSQR